MFSFTCSSVLPYLTAHIFTKILFGCNISFLICFVQQLSFYVFYSKEHYRKRFLGDGWMFYFTRTESVLVWKSRDVSESSLRCRSCPVLKRQWDSSRHAGLTELVRSPLGWIWLRVWVIKASMFVPVFDEWLATITETEDQVKRDSCIRTVISSRAAGVTLTVSVWEWQLRDR